ncbi:MAG: hypothetical protein JNK82_40315 [Myxococcaceae bacterium]|nr:hypothetical protein [Myxococcaceae bacterium]
MKWLLVIQAGVLLLGGAFALVAWRMNDRELWLTATAFSVTSIVAGVVLLIAAIVERRVLFAVGGLALGALALWAAMGELFVGAALADPAGRPVRRRRRRSAATAEQESVPAFARVALQLWAHGAPVELIARAHQAALDEIDHARRLGADWAPLDLPALDVGSVRQLAVESLYDGVWGEGRAAAQAARRATTDPDPVKRAMWAVIARDEQRHADLARDIVGWVRSLR